MDACIFVLTVNMLTPVYMSDRTTELAELNAGDKVCIMEILPGEWMQAHWSVAGIGHTGFLHQVTAHKEAVPTEPTPYEEHESLPPPMPAPTPAPPMPQQQHSYLQPNLDSPTFRPAALVMQCHPQQSTPYVVAYVNGRAAVIGGKTGFTRPYPVIEEHDDQSNHVFYVKTKRSDQDRTLFLAFDYSQRGSDVSATRVMAPNGYDAKDKCFMDWDDTK